MKNCGICKGAKMVKKFVQLTIEWLVVIHWRNFYFLFLH